RKKFLAFRQHAGFGPKHLPEHRLEMQRRIVGPVDGNLIGRQPRSQSLQIDLHSWYCHVTPITGSAMAIREAGNEELTLQEEVVINCGDFATLLEKDGEAAQLAQAH